MYVTNPKSTPPHDGFEPSAGVFFLDVLPLIRLFQPEKSPDVLPKKSRCFPKMSWCFPKKSWCFSRSSKTDNILYFEV